MKNLWFVPSVRRVVRPCVFFSLFLTIIGFGAATRTLQAQNAHFAGAQTAVGSGFSAPAGIAVDAAGNVYVADSGAGKVIRIPATDPTCSTLSDCTSVGTGLVHPRSVVLDASGNVYIADQGTNLVTKVLATDLTCATAGDCTNVGPALSSPEGVAVDANNNVYIADEGNARVLYVPAADLSCATPSDCKSVGTGLTAPAGVGVDRLNNIYIADTASTTILKVPSSDLACTTAGDCTTVGSGFSSPFDVAVNFNGDVFVADTGNNRIVKVPSSDLTCATVTDCKTVGFGMNQPTAVALTQFGNVYAADFGAGQALQVQVAGVNLGTINVGSTSGSVALTFTFDASVTLNSTTAYQVLTQGATGLDFKDAGSGTCATSSSFTVGQTCTVNVHFSPASPGLRLGSVALYDSTGNTLATANLFGTGSGPQAVFYPGTQSTILNPIPGAAGVAVDAAGNIYVTSYSLGNLYKITQSGGVYSASTIATGLSTPLGIAVDGMGNVFVATGNGVLKFTPSGGTYTQSSIVARTSYLVGVAVDQYGNIYYTDLTGSAVFRLLLSNGTYTSYSVGTSWAGPYGIAVDPSGNVYVSDYDSHAFYKETLGTNSFYTLSTIFSVASTDYPTSVALDASGNIYAAVLGGSIYRESPSGGGYTQTVVAATTTPPVYDVALDNSGNLYFTYENPSFSTDGLYEINVNGQPPLSLTFNNTAVNATSSDSPQGFSVWNIGNAPLIFTTPGTGTNPSYPTDFPDNSADTQLCTAASPLESAGFCDVSIDFSPLSSGSHNETVTLVDNTLNGTNATQSIAVSGTATGVSITLSPSSLAAETFNTAISPVTFAASGGTAPYTFTVVSGSLPPGVALASAGVLSGTPTSAGSYTFSVQAEDASSNIGSQAYSVTVNKAAPTLVVSNSPVTYTGSAQSATINPSTPGTVSNVQYNGSSTVPTAAGTYAVTADFAPTDTTNYTSLTGAAAGNFVIGQATPTLAVSNSPVTYSGSAQAATITPSVPGTVSAILYNGSSTVPTSAGTYAVTASFTPTDTTNYATLTGASAGSFVINKATPTLSVSNPSVPYTGTAQTATVVGSVPGTVSAILYNGSSTAPTTAGTYAVTASFTPTDTTNYATLTGASAGSFVINKATPTLSVSNPSVPYTGTAQAATVVGSVPGSVSAILYNGSSTAPTTAGTYAVTASFTPTDTTNYATLTGASAGNFVINKATPTLSVSNPSVPYTGTAQTATLVGSVPGTVSAILYNGSSTVPTSAGTYAVTASFAPTDTADYASLTGASAGNFVINKATPTLSVSNPSVPYTGTAQAATVVGSVPGSVSAILYNGSSTVPTSAGTYAVTASFTPTDTADYASLTGASAGNFVINKATPTLSVSNPSVPYTGTAQTATVIGSVPGTVSAILYNGSSTVPTSAGTYAVTASFTPTDTADYASLTGASAGNFVINKATPTLSVSNPSVPYTGTAQTATVIGSVPGSVSAILYNGSSTAPTTVGTYTITASYTPTDSTDYATLTGAAAGTFSITKATPTITWATPAGIAYGTALSSTQLDATSTVAGNLVYAPAAGSIPLAGTQTLSVTLTPTDTTDYNNATQTVQLVVSKASPSITWATPAAITYGTALGAAQLNASSTVAGTLVYTPAAGTVLGAGTQTLSVTLTPTDAADYATATQTVQLVVNKAAPAISWPAPAAINYGTALSATQLDATSTVAGAFVYTPTAGTVLSAGTQTLSVTLTPTDGTDYTSATQTVQLVVNKAGAPTITWSSPAAITYGTALSAAQLDASSTVAGTFVYTPAAGTVLNAGTQTLSVTLNPTDSTDYPTSTQTVQIVVNKATPTVTWATPAAITYGTALSAAQLNASGSVPGTLVYTPAAGTLLTAGLQTLSVTFTPTDSTDYSTVTQTVQLQVNKVAPSITWATPAAITYGTALSATQLDATATVPGTFDYTPSSGTVLSTGTQTLSVTFTPSDTTDYSSVTQTVQLTVKQATAPSITWAAPAAITYGTALGATQLDASATIPGAFVYSPAAGTVLAAGLQTLSVTFTPTDTTDYPTATQTVQITVNKANPSITWAVPAAISYGTALGAPQLDASSTVAGAFVYTPAAGTVLNAGTQTLSVTLTPTDNNDYNQATQTVSLTVNKAAQTITFTPPAAVAFGSAPITLTATGGASGNPVTFTLVSGPASLAGSTLSFTGIGTVVVDANEAGNANYLAATQVSQSINVTNAALTVTANNVSRVYGAANPTFTGSVSGAVNGDAFTETFSTTATASSPVGSYPIVPAVTGTDLADYTVTVQNGTLNVTQAGTSTTLAVSSSSINPGQSVTLTATVASATSGTPTGSVSFYDGSTLLGTGTLASGAATYAAAGLQSGSHTITAVYAGDTNFTGSSTTASTTIVVAALDFTLTVTGGSDETIKQGGDAYYQLQVNPTFGNYPGTVSFTATGLPAGATISFSPSTVPVNGGQQSVTATVVTAPGVGANVMPNIGRRLAPLGLALFLLPLAGARRMRRFGRGMSRLLSLLLLLAGLATAAAVSGCGGSVTKTTSPQTYTIGITATGGNAQHSVNVTLEIN